jgi:hypothetical protein
VYREYAVEPLFVDHRSSPDYQPERLVEQLKEVLQVANDTKLSYALFVPPDFISKLRCRRIGLSAALLIRMHDVSGLTMNNLRDLAGIPNPRFE